MPGTSDIPSGAVKDAVLSEYTTFRLGGPCKGLINTATPDELITAVRELNSLNLPFILIGGGSNLVVSDHGIDAYVLRYFSTEPLIELKKDSVRVTGSTVLDQLALWLAEHGYAGLNYTSGIPGTVGGAVVGNAGAFGKQVGDVLKTVKLLNRDGDVATCGPEALEFAYRSSNLREKGHIVLEAEFLIETKPAEEVLKERKEILALRATKHPDLKNEPCAGSFFRNIEPTSSAGRRQAAGWFLEEAGGKSLSAGGAKIFSKHANIIVKADGCSANDVHELSEKMKACVKEKFDLDLVREVKFVGNVGGYKPESGGLIW